jgi:hypothetical protein
MGNKLVSPLPSPDKTTALAEGLVKKGGVNPAPSTPPPREPPKGQGGSQPPKGEVKK